MSLAGAAPTGIGALAAAYVDAGMEGKAAEACDQHGTPVAIRADFVFNSDFHSNLLPWKTRLCGGNLAALRRARREGSTN